MTSTIQIATHRMFYKLYAIIPGGLGIMFLSVATSMEENNQTAFAIIGLVTLIIALILLFRLQITARVTFNRERNEVVISRSKNKTFTVSVEYITHLKEEAFFPINQNARYSQFRIFFKSQKELISIPFIIYDDQTELLKNYQVLRGKIVLQRYEKVQKMKFKRKQHS